MNTTVTILRILASNVTLTDARRVWRRYRSIGKGCPTARIVKVATGRYDVQLVVETK